MIRLILKSMVTGSIGSSFFLRVQLPEVNVSFYLEGCGNRSKDYVFLRVQLPEVNDSPNFEEYGNRKYRIILFLRSE